MPPAARITDMHTCPMFDGPKPHVGGPILPPGAPMVLIGGLPAARMGDMCTCVGPPDTIVGGNPMVHEAQGASYWKPRPEGHRAGTLTRQY